MDDTPLPALCTLDDYLREQAARLKKRGDRRPQQGSPGSAGDKRPLPLVPADGLFFLSRLSSPEVPRSRAGAPPTPTGTVEQQFRRAFNDVWARLPEPDRDRLLRYWRCESDEGLRLSLPLPPHPRPLIRLVDAGRWSPSFSTCDHLGLRLTFPDAVVTEQGELLPAVIARTLALALRHATRAHGALYLRVVDEPMERWEARHGTEAPDADREARLERLEKAYLRKYEGEVTRILRGWGFRPSGARAGR